MTTTDKDSSDKDPSGNDPSGNDPSGVDPSGDDPSGVDPSGVDPSGVDPSEKAASAEASSPTELTPPAKEAPKVKEAPKARAESEEAPIYFEETVVKVNRCAKVVKGGRRFSFSALVVIGNRGGAVGIGFGKAKEVPAAVNKAVKAARKQLTRIPLVGSTIPHAVIGRYGAARVKLIPAAPGTGIIAGASPRAVLEYAGVKDVLTKSMGSANPLNLVKATMNGLEQLRSRESIEQLRGVSLS